jgi:hypothetical protein
MFWWFPNINNFGIVLTSDWHYWVHIPSCLFLMSWDWIQTGK